MSLVSFGAGGWEYPEREIAGGLDDYHAGRGEAPGRWVGTGAAAIGLSGRVDREQLGRLFEQARHPLTGEQLGRAHQSFSDRQARSGFGLTFSAPKSVSTLWAVGGPGVTGEVRAAHLAAVEAALDYLERHAAFSRKGKGGVLQVDTDGLVAAAYVHRTSPRIPSSIPTCSSPTGCTASTGCGGHSMPASSTGARRRPAGSTRRPCGSSCAVGSA